ncbi:hypothetical protein Sbal625DRAFT_4053 [Shewanella baltica OS625]|jgi:hypothetical protein|nr:hypothetical protein Sbal678_2069 [Shewanella baltica OS678]AEH14151.1 hypothetical protein Sbal117_2433 [Shewanella baltica OS117]EHC04245.1 hypothetical protein Sbal625DRAFT_4053 [Shewanella baltica OS625]
MTTSSNSSLSASVTNQPLNMIQAQSDKASQPDDESYSALT